MPSTPNGSQYGTWRPVFSTALANKLIIKATGGVLRAITARLDSTAPTATYYLQVWNLADIPADTTAVSAANSMMAPFKVAHTSGTNDTITLDFAEGVNGGAGLTIGLSTSEFTATASGSYLSATALVF